MITRNTSFNLTTLLNNVHKVPDDSTEWMRVAIAFILTVSQTTDPGEIALLYSAIKVLEDIVEFFWKKYLSTIISE